MTERLHFHTLEKEMATHSSVLAWRIPGMAEPGGLLSMGLHRVGHDWNDLAAAAAIDNSKEDGFKDGLHVLLDNLFSCSNTSFRSPSLHCPLPPALRDSPHSQLRQCILATLTHSTRVGQASCWESQTTHPTLGFGWRHQARPWCHSS